MLETARDALLLADLSARALPWAYLAIAVLGFGLARGSPRLLHRWPRALVLAALLGAGALVTAGFGWLASGPAAWVRMALYVWTGLLATLVTVELWLLLGDGFDARRAKRVFSFVAAGGVVGALLGALLAAGVLRSGEPRHVVLGASGLYALAALPLLALGGARAPDRASEAPSVGAPPREAPTDGRDPYIQGLLVLVFLASVATTGVDFVFKSAVAAALPAERLGPFFARYHLAVNGAALALQLGAAPFLLRTAGVVPTLLALPLLMLAPLTTLALVGGLLPALLMKGVDGSLRHSLHRPALEIMFLAMDDPHRERAKGIASTMGQRGGQAVASVLILAVLALELPSGVLTGVLVGLLVGWAVVIAWLWPRHRSRTRIDVPSEDGARLDRRQLSPD
jgi:AAA family ATP:ADP antiporter